MQRNVVLAGLARLAVSLVLALLASAPAQAAEKALLNVIGYDADAKYFAFEEYGIQDGSGAAYSTVYVVDLAADKWGFGSPFAVDTLDDADPEARSLSDVRAEALARANTALGSLKLDRPATIIALNGDGERADTSRLDFWTPNCCGIESTENAKFTLMLAAHPAKSADDCQATYAEGMEVVGYDLSLDDGDAISVLHEDGDTLPASRRCTLGYGIYAVVSPMDRSFSRVAIIASWPFGFEGPDRRFLAVPLD